MGLDLVLFFFSRKKMFLDLDLYRIGIFFSSEKSYFIVCLDFKNDSIYLIKTNDPRMSKASFELRPLVNLRLMDRDPS